MLDHEPDTNDTQPTDGSGPADGSGGSSPTGGSGDGAPAGPPRRRRAATRKAGPPAPVFSAADSAAAAATPMMSAEAAPAAVEFTAPEPAPAEAASATADERPPAKKATRKRATKSTGDGAAKTPRKRATKKAAPAIQTDDPALDSSAADAPMVATGDGAVADGTKSSTQQDGDGPENVDGAPAADTEAALDEIRLALTAELPPAELTTDDQGPDAAPEQAADQLELTQPTRGDAALGEDAAPAEDAGSADDARPEAAADDDESDEDEDKEDEDEDKEDEDEDKEDEDDTTAEGGQDDGDTDDDGAPRRRRRRRGGRRRRRGGGGGDSEVDNRETDGRAPENRDAGSSQDETAAQDADAASDDSGDQPEPRSGRNRRSRGRGERERTEAQDAGGAGSGDDDSTDETGADDSGADDTGEDGNRRRRRRRRRRGEDNGPSADDPAEVVVRVREPRSRQKAAEEVTGIQGSTRMEAKRQRRREGREAGRRRAPILSEAEFLARREAVVRKMIIRQRDELSQIAVLEDDILVEHYVDRESAASLIGNVYLGRVQNVLPSMEAAFIDIGRGRNAVLYAGEVDWDAFGAGGQQRKVENVLKSGQTVLVQVTKDPVGAKGARLTSHVTLPGRYIVYAPGGHLSGISRKLPDNERKRLKSVLNDLVPESASVIVRTAAEGASEDELVRDVNRLKAQWEDIERKVKAGSAPKLLYGEPDLTVRIVRDLFTEDFAELIIQGNSTQADAYDAVNDYVGHVAPHLQDRIRRWDADGDGDLFARFRLDEQIAKALERKVFLPSGGSLIIDRTEAMTVIDVNTGKFTGSGGNLEATVTSNNLEAAEEIVRQLRLRDIGGIIVIDFIDMVLPANRELLLRRLVECLGRDRTRHQVAEVTSLGLVQMTRKKIGTGLLEAFTADCEHCHGRGYEIFEMPVETQKQPDGGSRDQRGGSGGGGGGRGRGRGGNQSGANGSTKPHHPVPAPPLHRPEPAPDPKAVQVTPAPDSAPEPAGPEPTSAGPESEAAAPVPSQDSTQHAEPETADAG